MTVTVHAHLRQTSTGLRDAPEPAHREVQVVAASYEAGRDKIQAELPPNWIIASWKVER